MRARRALILVAGPTLLIFAVYAVLAWLGLPFLVGVQ
jgi:hypothetical protein